MRRRSIFVISAIAATIAFGGTAQAAQRFAAPTGTGLVCSQGAPCDLPTAITGASNGDEVIVTAGNYTTTLNLIAGSQNLNIHGVAGQRPTITSTASLGLQLNGAGSKVSDLELINTNNSGRALVLQSASTAERILASAVGNTACELHANSILRDSVCRFTGALNLGAGVVANDGSSTIRLRNVTAVAVAGSNPASFGLLATNQSFGNLIVDARNVIADGPSEDIHISTSGGAQASVTLASSAYGTVGPGTITPPGTVGNITAQPVFTDASLHQAATSPTVDAGTADPQNGTLDVDGEPRPQGAAIDIGGDELAVVPPDTTPPETKIDKGPKKKSKKKKATFTFSATEAGSTFVCRLDKKAEAPCTSPLKLKKLKKGKHKLTVVATDAAGNADASPATYGWKVKRKKKR